MRAAPDGIAAAERTAPQQKGDIRSLAAATEAAAAELAAAHAAAAEELGAAETGLGTAEAAPMATAAKATAAEAVEALIVAASRSRRSQRPSRRTSPCRPRAACACWPDTRARARASGRMACYHSSLWTMRGGEEREDSPGVR